MKTKSFAIIAIYLMAGAFFVLFNAGCSKDEAAIDSAVYDVSIEEKNANLELLGKAFALYLGECKAFRSFVKGKAMEQITFDYDVPYFWIKDKVVEGKTVEQHLTGYIETIAPGTDLNQLVGSLHYVQLTIPFLYIDEWDAATLSNVVVLPIGRRREEISELLAYKPTGDCKFIPYDEEPSEQFVVIRESDRIDDDGQLIVSKEGVVIAKEERQNIHDFLDNNNELKNTSATANQSDRLVVIVSEDSLDAIKKRAFTERFEIDASDTIHEQIYYYNDVTEPIPEAKNSIQVNKLVGFSNQARKMILEWESAGSNIKYDIVVKGPFPYGNGEWVAARNLNSLSYVLHLNYSWAVSKIYNIQVIGKRNGVDFSESNHFPFNVSDREQGCKEYISRIFLTREKIIDLEGRWASHLEFKSVIAMGGGNGETSLIRRGMTPNFVPNIVNLRTQDTQRTYNSSAFGVLEWYKNIYPPNSFPSASEVLGFHSGAYRIMLFENDSDSKKKYWELAGRVVQLGIKYSGLSSDVEDIVELAIDIGKETFRVDQGSQRFITYEVKWETPQKAIFNNTNVLIEHSFKNP